MTGGPDLRLASAEGALPGRPAGAKLARSGEGPATPFDALLARMGPKTGAAPAAGGGERPVGRPVGGDLRRAPAASLDAKKVGTEAGAEAVSLDAAQQGQGLAHGVAERIAASLQAGQAKSTPPGSATEADVDGRRDAALTASIAVAASLARRADGLGIGPGRASSPALAVTHRETVFAAATLASVAAQIAGGDEGAGAEDPFGDPASARAGTAGPDAGPAAMPQGRAEQLMLGDRAAAARGAVPARGSEGGAAGTPGHPGASESGIGGELPQPGETAQGRALDSPTLGLPGAADQRSSAAAPPSAVPAAQAAAAPPTFSAVAGAVKVLHIQLHPAELGVLEVKMRMTDGGLEVRIEASRQETVALLKSDRDTLESVLRGAGHSVDAVTVSLAEKSGGASGQPSQDGWQPPASGARPDAQPGSPREQGGRFDDRSPSRPDGQANEKVHDDQTQPAAAAVRPRGALYL